MYDCSGSEAANQRRDASYEDGSISKVSDMDDEDKLFFKKIGKTEISIDRILCCLLDDDDVIIA